MDCVLFSEIVFVDEGYRVAVFLGQLAFSWGFFFLFHEIHTEDDTTVAGNQVVEMFASTNAHVVNIGPHYFRYVLHSMGGLGIAKLGFCIQ